MIIKTHSDITISSSISDNLILQEKNKANNNKKNDLNVDLSILEEIQLYGYDKKYVLKCVQDNILCHASTVFYLLKNYRNIE